MNLTLFGFCFLGIIFALGQAQKYAGRARPNSNNDGRAQNPNPNCDCQCDSYVWKDSYKRIMGNCESETYTPGGGQAIFCYVTGKARRACTDVLRSPDLHNRYYSFEACATPEPNSPQCSSPPPICWSLQHKINKKKKELQHLENQYWQNGCNIKKKQR